MFDYINHTFKYWCFNGNNCFYLERHDLRKKDVDVMIDDRIFFYSETKEFALIIISGQIENIKFSKEGTLEGTKGWSGNFAHNKKVFNWSGKFYFKELENLNLGTG